MKYVIPRSSVGAQHIQYLGVFKDWKSRYFDKWHEVLIQQPPTASFNNQFVKILNSDLSVTISYLDTIFTDLLADWEALQKSGKGKINFLHNSHIFSLLILTRSVLLNTAYCNVYYELKDELREIDYDIFENRPKFNSGVTESEIKNLIDLFSHCVKVFEFGNGDKIRIIGQIEGSIKELFIKKQVIQSNKDKVSDLDIIKNLEHSLNKEFSGFFKQSEISTLYELTSKTFHRHELLLGYLNSIINDPKYGLEKCVLNTIHRIVQICLISFGYQARIFLELIEIDPSVIDLKGLIQE